MNIHLYDTTLRDGTQGEGFNLSLADKLLVARKLDEVGFDYIEGGFPLSNPKDVGFFEQIRDPAPTHAKVSAFGMTRRRGVKAAEDAGVRALLDAETPVITIVGKTIKFQIENVLSTTVDENQAMIADSVGVCAEAGREVIYDAEHFFDAFKEDRQHALATLAAAESAGASVLCLCDTNGGTMPSEIAEATAAVVAASKVRVGIHTHNDSGVAVANALAAVEAGATHVQGTINGVGERCGNMDLVVAAANLALKFGHDVLQPDSLERLTELSRFVYEVANVPLWGGQPYVGASAFAHKGGMHVHAVRKHAGTYEHVDPAAVGNARKILVSEMSGASNIAEKLGKKFGIETDRDVQRRVLERVQDLENEGFVFEAAEASFELLLRKEIGKRRDYFTLDHYRCVILRTDADRPVAEATVKVHVGEAVEHQV
ncbi:MAG: citramalate synthase, partial [Planctomycetota bacterium]